MRGKILNFLLLLTSLFGYLEWGKDNQMFLFEAEADIFEKLFSDPLSVIHPLILLPLAGQVLLLITLFQVKSSKILTHIGFWSIAVLLLMMFIVGILNLNFKIILSTLPFLLTGVVTIIHHAKKKQNSAS